MAVRLAFTRTRGLRHRCAESQDCDQDQSRKTVETELHKQAFLKASQNGKAGGFDLPRKELLRSGENAGKPELVVSGIVKVCKGVRKRLYTAKQPPEVRD